MRKFLTNVTVALMLALALAACGYPGKSPPANTCINGEHVGTEWDGDRQFDLDGDGKVDCKITTHGEVICLDDTEWSINHRPDYYPRSSPAPVPATPEPSPTATCAVHSP